MHVISKLTSSLQIIKTTWKATNIPELKNATPNTRTFRASHITLYRTNERDSGAVDDLTKLACHSRPCQDKNYNYSDNVRALYKAKNRLENLRTKCANEKIEDWQR